MQETKTIQIQHATQEKGVQIIFITKDCLSDANKKNIRDSALLEELGYKAKGNFYAQANKVLYVGLEEDTPLAYADAACNAIKSLKSLQISESSLNLKDLSADKKYHVIQGLLLGGYEYQGFKSKKDDMTLCDIIIHVLHLENELLQKAQIICGRVNFVRDVVNTPPNIATSVYLSDLAQNETMKIVRQVKHAEVKATVRSNSYLEEQKMGAFLAVNQASNFPAFLVHLSYKPQHVKKKVAIVGKGLVYDTGGLSLKPADYMSTMKADKGGACAVLGAFLASVELGLDVELHAIMGITDNAIGKNAYRPDDVLISREKKSIEVKNTDAEGRLVLADCLSYAQDLNVDIIMDFATLTGACVVALGEYTSGVMGFNEELKASFVESALKSGELAHTLPFNLHLKKLIESKIADVSNTSTSRYGGAITAGLFLGEFIRDSYKDKWLHIDIAGPAYVEKEWGVNPHGASGIGVRSCVEFLSSLN